MRSVKHETIREYHVHYEMECDRCGEKESGTQELDDERQTPVTWWGFLPDPDTDHEKFMTRKHLDICPACWASYRRWMDARRDER